MRRVNHAAPQTGLSAGKRLRPDPIRIQRAYVAAGPHDGYRVLVDRFWPRGCRRDELRLDEWARDLAPPAALIRWFAHDAVRWDEFRVRYHAELAGSEQRQRLCALLEAAAGRPLTLVYGARDERRNQAVVLREALLALDCRPG